MLEDRGEPDSSGSKRVTLRVCGFEFTVSKGEYDAAMRIAGLDNDVLMLHEALRAARDLDTMYLPEEFRRSLIQAILYTAGDSPAVRRCLLEDLLAEDGSEVPDDFSRIARILTIGLSVDEATASLPNTPLRIGDIRQALEDLVSAQRSLGVRQDAETRDLVGDSPRKGARMAMLRFISTFHDSREE